MSDRSVIAIAVGIVGLLALFLVVPSHAQDPFRSGGATAQAAQPSAPPGIATRIWFQVQKLQRETQQQIQSHMKAIKDDGSSSALLIGMGLAILYGVIHTAGPGHGKMVVASYFLGHDARPMRGMLMGLRIAVTHVIAAVVLVGLADITVRSLMGGQPDQVWWMQLANYGAIAAIGVYMLVRAVGRLKRGESTECPHDHGHGHGHGHGRGRKLEGLLAAAAGLVPCTGALLIMLYALANGIVLAGILLVVCISLGMAAAVAILGVLCIVARRWIVSAVETRGGGGRWLFGGLELLGSLAIAALGLAMVVATVQAG